MCASVNAQLDPKKVEDGVQIKDVNVQGKGFIVYENGNFASNGGYGKIGGHDILGDITKGQIESGKFSYMKNLSKDKIKEVLRNKTILDSIDYVLRKTRVSR